MAQTNDQGDDRASESTATDRSVRWSSPSGAVAGSATPTHPTDERVTASAVVFSDLAGRSAAGSTPDDRADQESRRAAHDAGEVARDAAASLRFSS